MLQSRKKEPPTLREQNEAIREAVVKAALKERAKARFNLSGRGHEPRLTLSPSVAAVLRHVSIPRLYISGYGANFHYPTRIFKTAEKLLRKRLGWSPLEVSTSIPPTVDRVMLSPEPRHGNARSQLHGNPVLVLTLPDNSQVALDTRAFRFRSLYGVDTVKTRQILAAKPKERKPFWDVDFAVLTRHLERPDLPFGECFRSLGPGKYSPYALHDFNLLSITKEFHFPGTHNSGIFSVSTEWNFLDGGIRHESGDRITVRGTEALRALCMWFGIVQPRRFKEEHQRRPLSILLEELSAFKVHTGPTLGLPAVQKDDRAMITNRLQFVIKEKLSPSTTPRQALRHTDIVESEISAANTADDDSADKVTDDDTRDCLRRNYVEAARRAIYSRPLANASRSVVYGEYPAREYLVFIPEPRARFLAQVWRAVFESETWADLKRLAPPAEYREIRRYNREVQDRHPIELRATAPFDWEKMTAVQDGDYPGWPAQEMFSWVPRDIQRDFGTALPSALNGECLNFAPKDTKAIVQRLKQAGFRCRRNQRLVEHACGD